MIATLIYFLAPQATGKTVAARAMAARLAEQKRRVVLLDDYPLCMARERRKLLAEIAAARAQAEFVIVTNSHPCAAEFLPPAHFIFHPVDARQAGRKLWRDRKPAKKGRT